MAKLTVYGTQRTVNPRTGKVAYKKAIKSQVKATGSQKKLEYALKQAGLSSKPTKNQLQRDAINANKEVQLAKVAGRVTNVGTLASSISNAVSKSVNAVSQSGYNRLTTNDNGVNQIINGGIAQGGNSRDEDDSGWVD